MIVFSILTFTVRTYTQCVCTHTKHTQTQTHTAKEMIIKQQEEEEDEEYNHRMGNTRTQKKLWEERKYKQKVNDRIIFLLYTCFGLFICVFECVRACACGIWFFVLILIYSIGSDSRCNRLKSFSFVG